ncbi:galactokinase family protein [Flagellimonas myxillae]|uniref:GHMP family kinase ATP-binding protein n=1 Tax=Flagellimonas myxillae TaxID=2942214 RepID=UPI00201ECF51|nr:galactokinase family protein [Muricauda myxillae]MCL6265454.1 galactokinase [Muricauda myxillae]
MKEKIVAIAPGRTCLFGDHQDYLGLPVIACAFDRHIQLSATKNTTEKLVINMPDIDGQRVIDLNAMPSKVKKGDHLMAALQILERFDCFPEGGYDLTISGNVAINSGTSSSSALLITWTLFLVTAYGCNVPVTKEFVSQVAYEAEVTFHGAPGGKMDQYSIGLGGIIYLETGENLNFEVFHKPLTGLIVAESGIPKDTTGVLGELKEKALLAINKVKEKLPNFEISEVTKADLPKYRNYVSDELKIFLDAAVLNHDVTQKALKEFKRNELDPVEIGNLMNQHHNVLKNYLNITVPRIDAMVDGALGAGALGAKIVGSGRGGSIVVLARDGEQDKVIQALIKAGAKDAYAVQVDKGAQILEPKLKTLI